MVCAKKRGSKAREISHATLCYRIMMINYVRSDLEVRLILHIGMGQWMLMLWGSNDLLKKVFKQQIGFQVINMLSGVMDSGFREILEAKKKVGVLN